MFTPSTQVPFALPATENAAETILGSGVGKSDCPSVVLGASGCFSHFRAVAVGTGMYAGCRGVCWKWLGKEGGEHSGFRLTLAEPRKCRRGWHEFSRHALVRSTSKEISFYSVSAPPPLPLSHSLSVRRRMSSQLPRRDPGWKQKPSWLA